MKYLTQHYEESDFVVGKAYHSRTEAEIEEITHYCKEALATKSTNRERNDFISDIMIKEFSGCWNIITGYDCLSSLYYSPSPNVISVTLKYKREDEVSIYMIRHK